MLMGNLGIREAMAEGSVIVDPFRPDNLGSAQYDVTLGRHFWRDARGFRLREDLLVPDQYGERAELFNPYDEEDVKRRFRPGKLVRLSRDLPNLESGPAFTLGQTFAQEEEDEGERSRFAGIGDAEVILIAPGESLLCHTEEFIGGRGTVTTSMRARSSLGRIGISVCLCAGLGDVGYFNRWTMEVRNHSSFAIPLIPGRRVAQIQFWRVAEKDLPAADQYASGGKYQGTEDLEKLKRDWKPEDMLPKMWRDREVKALGHGKAQPIAVEPKASWTVLVGKVGDTGYWEETWSGMRDLTEAEAKAEAAAVIERFNASRRLGEPARRLEGVRKAVA